MERKDFDNIEDQFLFEYSIHDDKDFDIHHKSYSKSEHQGRLIRKKNKKVYSGHGKNISTSKCQQLADIIGGVVVTSKPVCVIQRLRNINATILDRRTRSPLALPFALSFENDESGKTLNLGESVVLQKEINPLLSALRKRGIIVTAVHNHWLFEEPRLMYMHWENVGDPFEFARESFEAAVEAGLF